MSVNSIKLFWTDNSNGEQGYKIDKKVGEGEWQNEYVVLDENTTAFIDENVDWVLMIIIIEFIHFMKIIFLQSRDRSI